ncbi:Flp pilus assembly protein CpaB [Fictibacillus sp. b24]|uniref:Flp pilus assembly protein CpaB n=1 Tax=Fictibacillus sp. b24 TaxID=3055863 RepID=UPI0025A294E8|nr:Flp pilus assembly protein CpaB [Fictibacillus sp. b24]MDM5318223.1 Flp pilus assembly protein CpaB [Fictibacillus sp. b24]
MIDAKRKALIFLSLAFILAIVTAGLILNEIKQAQTAMGETVEVASASKDIGSNREISEDQIEWIEMPKSSVVPSFIQRKNDLDKKIALVNIKKGDILSKNMLRGDVDIPADHRVVMLNPTENVLIDEEVTPGDIVDVIVSTEEKEGLKTQRLLKNVSVVQAATMPTKDNPDAKQIKVSLTVQDAEQLIHYQNKAKQIRVLLVNTIAEEAGEPAKETTAPEKAPAKQPAQEKPKAPAPTPAPKPEQPASKPAN